MRNEPPLKRRDHDWHPKADFPDYRSTTLRHPKQSLIAIPQALQDTTGPAFGHDILGANDDNLTINSAQPGASAIGERLLVHGRVLDGAGRVVPNVLLEVWQANAGGRYRHKNDGYLAPLDPNFAGCGRCLSDSDGNYAFRTIKPGPYPWPNGGNDWRPAHIHFSVFGTAFSQRLITQMYFEGDPHIQICPIVQSIADPRAVSQLTARLDMSRTIHMDMRAYRFDIVLRGPDATYFENRTEGA